MGGGIAVLGLEGAALLQLSWAALLLLCAGAATHAGRQPAREKDAAQYSYLRRGRHR